MVDDSGRFPHRPHVLGLFFPRENFLGGYSSWPRRLTRLGHIALAAIGLLNVVYAITPLSSDATWRTAIIDAALILGGIAMPAVCFLSAWKKPLKFLFFLPVSALTAAVLFILTS